jgi:hypothetical protein
MAPSGSSCQAAEWWKSDLSDGSWGEVMHLWRTPTTSPPTSTACWRMAIAIKSITWNGPILETSVTTVEVHGVTR